MLPGDEIYEYFPGTGIVGRAWRELSRRSLGDFEMPAITGNDWPDFCELNGLPRDFDLPGWSIAAKYRAVGNGVPIPMARAVAIAILTRGDTGGRQMCVCECGRTVIGKATHATPACRKRMERRRRDTAAVTRPGLVTPA